MWKSDAERERLVEPLRHAYAGRYYDRSDHYRFVLSGPSATWLQVGFFQWCRKGFPLSLFEEVLVNYTYWLIEYIDLYPPHRMELMRGGLGFLYGANIPEFISVDAALCLPEYPFISPKLLRWELKGKTELGEKWLETARAELISHELQL